MVMIKKYLFVSITALAASAASAQPKAWTLKECADYAVEHNINIKQSEINLKQNEVRLSSDRSSWLPSINASAGQDFAFGRGLTSENTYTNRNTSSTSFGLSASMPLFTGLRITNSIAQSKLDLQAATADLEKARSDIHLQVAAQYVQILFSMELDAVAQRQIAIDSMQVARLRAVVEAGKASAAELARQQATLAASRLAATQADNNYRLAVLALSQLLELPSPEGFSIACPDVSAMPLPDKAQLPAPDAIYAEAVALKPEIQAEKLRVMSAEKGIDVARAGYYPQLSLTGGMGSNYYNVSGGYMDGFGRQLKNNFSQHVGLSLSVPIFNRFETRNGIRMAKLQRDNQMLRLESVRKTLYKEIQQAYYNAVAAADKYSSSRVAMASSEAAFDLTKAKYENGRATITEFNEAKADALKSQSDLLQAKYEYLYQNAIINFYRGKDLDM